MTADIPASAPPQRHPTFWQKPLFRWLVFVLAMAAFIPAYISIGKLLIEQTNRTPDKMFGGDQMHNLRLATEVKPDQNPDFTTGFSQAFVNFFPHNTDGVVQPLWPWVAAWLTTPDHKVTEEAMQTRTLSDQDRALFDQGRWFNVILTGTFLLFLGIAAMRRFSLPAALNLVLLGGFGALLPRAAFFQPEPLFYIFFFLTWVACIATLKHNTLWMYAIIGILSGIAYMAKGSIQPLLMAFVGISSLRCVWEMIIAWRKGCLLGDTHQWHWQNHLVGLVMLAVAHLLTIGPRLTDSYEKFGSMTHSYPGYWMWFDTFGGPDTVNDPETAYGWMDKHNTKEELLAMRPEDKPSLGRYIRTHTGTEIWQRASAGTQAKLEEFFLPKQTKRADKIEKQKPWRGIFEWRGWYLAWLGLTMLTLLGVLCFAVPKAEHAGHIVFQPGTLMVGLFVVGSFIGYSLAYGWYDFIGRGERFMMSLYLPLVFSLIFASESIVNRIRRRQGHPWIRGVYVTAHWMLFFALVWRLYEIFRVPQFQS